MGDEPSLKVRMCQVMLLEDDTSWDKHSLTYVLADRGWLPDNDHPHNDRGLRDVVGQLLENNAGVLFIGTVGIGLTTYTLTGACRDRLPGHFEEQGWVLVPASVPASGRTVWERLLND